NWYFAGEFVDPGISANTIERPGTVRGVIVTHSICPATEFVRTAERSRSSQYGFYRFEHRLHRVRLLNETSQVPFDEPLNRSCLIIAARQEDRDIRAYFFDLCKTFFS